jgi:hypothetical protein
MATTKSLLLEKTVHSFIRQLNWSIIKDRKNNVTQMNDKSLYFPNKTSSIFLLSLKAEGHFICKNDEKSKQNETQFNNFWENNQPASVNISEFAQIQRSFQRNANHYFITTVTTIPVQNKSGPTVLQLRPVFKCIL